jgi:hypothetical protein
MKTNERLRHQIAFEAARLIVGRRETQFYRAKLQAARLICHGVVRPDDLPSNREIRSELTILQCASGPELAELLGESTTSSMMADQESIEHDRFLVFQMLLEPLEQIRPNSQAHPEGDLLYHSLQVFQLARDASPYDDELLLAALLHDVGRAIDRKRHIEAALDVLGEMVSQRTAWLIEHHAIGRGVLDQSIGVRARRRLEASEDFDDLMLLCRADRDGRQRGIVVPDIEEALDCIRALSEENGE